jgi:hypothetical protein
MCDGVCDRYFEVLEVVFEVLEMEEESRYIRYRIFSRDKKPSKWKQWPRNAF